MTRKTKDALQGILIVVFFVSVLTLGGMFKVSSAKAQFFVPPSDKRHATQEQPRSAKAIYVTSDYRVYCEEPNGNEIYVAGNPVVGGVAINVVPGGCR